MKKKLKNRITESKSIFVSILVCLLFTAQALEAQVPDANLGKRANWMRGSWGLNWKPVYYTNDNVEKDMSIEPFLEQIEHLETIDYIQIHLTESSIYSACHTAPHDILESFWEGDMVDGSPVNLIVPRASTGQDQFLDWLEAIKARGLKTMVYVNTGNLLWDSQPDDISEVKDRWKAWCDTNAADFIASKSYHTDENYPDRPYYFCYAEYILKEYAERYGDLIDAWLFDTAKSKFAANGDDPSVEDIESQRLYQAFADAVHSGNPNAAVSFNNGTGSRDLEINPFGPGTFFDDYTFGHPFGGAGDMVETDALYEANYGICSWMQDYEGYAFLEDDVTWNDNVVSHFDPKMSTTAWNRGATPCLTNDEFVEWNATALINGGAISWGAPLIRPFMDRDPSIIDLTMHDYAVEQLTLMDAYLQENQCATDGNLALTGTATQSTTKNGGAASRAIDGNTDGTWANGSVTHTSPEDNAWWALDLDAEYSIGEIVIYNRTDACCVDRLSDFTLFVWDAEGNRTFRKFITTTPDPYIAIDAGDIMGKSIKIVSNLTNTPLSLAEVQVFQGNLALTGTASQSSTDYDGEASRAIDGNTDGIWANGSVTHTATEDNPWWEVFLDAEHSIGEIKIYNRTDACCTENLSDFTVFIWDAESNRTYRKFITTTPDPYVTIDAGGVTGKRIRIKSNLTAAALNLAEVQVYRTASETTSSARSSSEKLAIEEVDDLTLKLYPNPTKDQLTIKAPNILNATYSLINYVGKTVFTGEIKEGMATVDVSSLQAGIYFVKVEGEQESFVKKVVKK